MSMENIKLIQLFVGLNKLVHEMVDCDMEPHVEDLFLMQNYAVFVFKKSLKITSIKYISIVFKDKITIFESEGIYQIVFSL